MKTLATILILLAAAPVSAQVDGHASVILDVLPDLEEAEGAQSVTELRMRLFAEWRNELNPHLRINLAAYVDGLLADRSASLGYPAKAGLHDAIVRPADLYIEIVTPHFDLRAGAARLVWGRLDEFQPTDVVNPLDLSRFLMEGRSEARLPVGLVRARVFLPRSTTIEAVAVPHFRSGRFDQLEEPSSPFNLTRTVIPRVRDEPSGGAESLQGGVRLTSTTARVDWSVSAYRGRKAFPISTLAATADAQPFIRESFPRFTMIGADFETVRGVWGLRGEIASFVDDELQSTRTVQGVPGRSVSAGVGVDRKAGDYRVAGNVLLSWSGADESALAAPAFAGEDVVSAFLTAEALAKVVRRTVDDVERTDVALVIAADRSFARETRSVRVFGVYDPADATMFTRVIGAASLRDNVWIEGSAGLFTGTSLDIIGRLSRRDFAYARLKVFF